MVFSNQFFLYFFLPLTLIATLMTSKIKVQNWILLVFSLFFYAWGEPLGVFLMVGTGTFAWLMGFVIERSRTPRYRRYALIASVVVMLGSLFVFKYANFFLEQLNLLPFLEIPPVKLRMPIGISFYTFQVLTYVIDLYRRDVPLQTKWHKFLLYQSLFPQLIAGPIVRYSDIAYQMDNRTITVGGVERGASRFLVGLAKKIILADGVAELVAKTLDTEALGQLPGIAAWAGLIAYAFQIYLDFSGYSDMAIGMGSMFGFTFKENFRYPYVARSITEFWRRWHISLSSFFRDYVYIPLGGNRRYQMRNMLVVWALTGFWHGASWNFIFWGLYFFVLLVFEKTVWLKVLDKIPRIFGHLYALFAILIGWVFFYFTDLSRGMTLLKQLFRPDKWIDPTHKVLVLQFLPLLLVCLLASLPIVPWVRKLAAASMRRHATSPATEKGIGATIRQTLRNPRVRIGLASARNLLLLFLCTMFRAASTYTPFLYFRF